MRLADVLLRASLITIVGCECPDGRVDTTAFATRKSFFQQIDACIASDAHCEALCRAVLELPPEIAIPECVITAASPQGAALDITYFEPIDCGIGRKPAGYRPASRIAAAGAAVGAWLAHVAALEAASVTAFARLARALACFGAPARFITAARRAIADELSHAALTAGLARRFGARVTPPVIDATPPPSLEHLAFENAVEGQVGETLGALIATCQSRSALDPAIRIAFGEIAVDEARHAALAHQLAPWFEARLEWPARDAVARARQQAIAGAVARCDVGLAGHDRDVLGLPAPAQLRAAALQVFRRVC
jgi:hypothetical protein